MLELLKTLITGGFAKGYRTHILGFGVAVNAFSQYAIGDLSLAGLQEQLPEILGGLGLMSARSALTGAMAKVQELIELYRAAKK
jgi:hypothetical protein